jgi:hypothetical protein
MRALVASILLAGAAFSGVASAATPAPSVEAGASIDELVTRVYAIPYRDAVCAFSNIDRDTGQYLNRKFNDKKVREATYRKTFSDVFSASLFQKLTRQCVNATRAGLKPDFRTGDLDEEDGNLSEQAPTLKVTGKPVVIQKSADRLRLKVLWRKSYAGGDASSVTDGRTDLILVREGGGWRIDDAIANPTKSYRDLDVSEFDNATSRIQLRGE